MHISLLQEIRYLTISSGYELDVFLPVVFKVFFCVSTSTFSVEFSSTKHRLSVDIDN